jgi:lipoprotein-releasing system permease protein
MYKLLLCLRYLRTRYIALASIVSVTLGVATMIVVNSVMAGFSHEMQNRIHGILSDVVIESYSLDGFPDAEWHMQRIRELAGEYIEGMTPTVVVPAMLNGEVRGRWITRQITLIGVDAKTHSQVSDFGRYLQHPQNRTQLSFDLHESGYDTRDHQAGNEASERTEMGAAGWQHRRWWGERQNALDRSREFQIEASTTDVPAIDDPFAKNSATGEAGLKNPFPTPEQGTTFDPTKEQWPGAIMGIALGSVRGHDGKDRFLFLPGDDVKITLPSAGIKPEARSKYFTIVDFYESKMSEYDASFVFVPMEVIQEMRGMVDPTTGVGHVTSIQIKLKPGADGNVVRDKLRAVFPPEIYGIQTWRDKQGPLLAAVQMETAILNVLLFLIIAVAGFGILAIFFMIVVEKTRDIGILKSLGASSRGIMSIFLAYGLSLGIVGSGVGMIAGLLFVIYINEIADLLSRITGQPVFDPAIYYFQRIPTIIDPFTVSWIVMGAMLIAVLASILPARRAARLHPVEALRYE